MDIEIQTPNKGWFQPGTTRNPGGRPKVAKTITDALRRYVEKGDGEKIAKNMIQLALHAKQSAVQVKAAEFIADRLEGRPMQAIAMLQVMDDNTAKRLIQVAQAFMQVNSNQTSASLNTRAQALTLPSAENSEST
jgi:hypothetical protein